MYFAKLISAFILGMYCAFCAYISCLLSLFWFIDTYNSVDACELVRVVGVNSFEKWQGDKKKKLEK